MEHGQIAARLRLALEREAAKHEVSPGAWSQIERRLRRQTWRRAGIVAVCAAVAAAGAATAPYLRHAISGPVASHPHPRPAPQLVIVGRTHLSSHGVTFLTAGHGGVWAVGRGVIYRVDPATAKTVATIPAPGVGYGTIATGAGAVWATSAGGHPGVYRIDPRANRVTSFIRLQPTPITITVAYGRVWVTDDPASGAAGVVFRIDPQSNRVTGPPIRVGFDPGQLVPHAGALWVGSGKSNGSMSRIDPATGVVTRILRNIERVDAVGAGSLWVMSTYDGIQRVDPATGQVTATIRLPNAVGVIFWAGSAWVLTNSPSALVRIDPTSNRIVGKPTPVGPSPYIAAGPSGLWVADFTTGELLHLTLASAAK
jgi:DNA-binding beta-propeller fold protein YncE